MYNYISKEANKGKKTHRNNLKSWLSELHVEQQLTLLQLNTDNKNSGKTCMLFFLFLSL